MMELYALWTIIGVLLLILVQLHAISNRLYRMHHFFSEREQHKLLVYQSASGN